MQSVLGGKFSDLESLSKESSKSSVVIYLVIHAYTVAALSSKT